MKWILTLAGYCDCERVHNGLGLIGRECDCQAPIPDDVWNETVEKMARAIFAQEGMVHMDEGREFEPMKWDELDDPSYPVVRDDYRSKASACLRALGIDRAAAGEGEG